MMTPWTWAALGMGAWWFFTPARLDKAPHARATQQHVDLAQKYGKLYNVTPSLIMGVIEAESGFNSGATSPVGAQGLMQLMPETADWLGKKLGLPLTNDYDPTFNVQCGAWYVGYLLKKFGHNESHAIAAYNAGAGRVQGWLDAGQPLASYSQGYVDKVLAARDRWARFL